MDAVILCCGQVSERSLPPPPPQQQSLHDRVLAEIKQERKLRPVVQPSSRRKDSTRSCTPTQMPNMTLLIRNVYKLGFFSSELKCVRWRFYISRVFI